MGDRPKQTDYANRTRLDANLRNAQADGAKAQAPREGASIRGG